MKRPCLVVAAAMCACALSTHSQAAALEASSSVNLSGLYLRLIDLDTTDGITPSMQIINGDLSWEAVANFYTTSNPAGEGQASLSQPIDFPNWLMPVEVGLSPLTGQSSASITTSSISTNASATMDTATAKTGASHSAAVSTDLIESRFFQYSLSANTALIIGGRYDLRADVQADESVGYGSAEANFVLHARRLSPEGEWADYIVEDYVAVWASSGTDFKQDSIDLFLANESATSQLQELKLSTWTTASTQGIVSDVPEPAFMSLMVAGLGVIGFAARSKGQRPN